MDAPKLDFAGVIVLGLDPSHGPYIYHQYPPDIAVSASAAAAAATASASPQAQTKVVTTTTGHQSLLGDELQAAQQQQQRSPTPVIRAASSDEGISSSGVGHPSTSMSSMHSVFATVKNFAEVFLPRPELTGRVCWHYEADTSHVVMYMPLEFVGSQYRRNLLRMTVCFVFGCAPMMTTSGTDIEDELNAYSLALLNVAELLKDAEVRYGYLFHYLDPMGDYYDMNRPLRSSIENGGSNTMTGTAGSSTLKTTLLSSGSAQPRRASLHSAATPLGASFEVAGLRSGSGHPSLAPPQQGGVASPTPSEDLFVKSQRLSDLNNNPSVEFVCGDGDPDHDDYFPSGEGSGAGRGVAPLTSMLMSTESFDIGIIANNKSNNNNHHRIETAGLGSSVELATTARDVRSPDILRWIPCNTQGALAAENAFIFSVSPPMAFSQAGGDADAAATTVVSLNGESTNGSAAPRQLGVSLYDLSFVIEKVFDCMVGTCEAIPLSEHSSIPIHCARRTSKSIYIYPEQRVVPIVSPGEVLQWMGDEMGWGDLSITDVFFLVDGIRTVAEIADQFNAKDGSSSNASVMTPLVREALCAMKPVEETSHAGCKRKSNKVQATGGSSKGTVLTGGGVGGRRLEPVLSTASATTASGGGGPPADDVIPHQVVLTLEALQHLHHCNLVRMLDPIVGGGVYVCTPAFYTVLSDEDHPGRWELGLRMLAVQAAVTQCSRRLSDNQMCEGNNGELCASPATETPCETPERQKIRRDKPPPGGNSVRSPVPTVSFGAVTMEGGAAGGPVSLRVSKQQLPAMARIDSSDVLEASMLPWEAMSMTGTFGAEKSSSAAPPQLTATASDADNDICMETPQERTRIGTVLNIAALRGYPPMAPTIAAPTTAELAGPAVQQLEEMVRLEAEVHTAASAALCALVKFQFITVQSVRATMRASPVWGTAFHQWCGECMITLVEFGALNGWLRLHKKM